MTQPRADNKTRSPIGPEEIPLLPKPRRRSILVRTVTGIAVVVLSAVGWTEVVRPHQCGGPLYDRDLVRVGDQCIGTISDQDASFSLDVDDIIKKIVAANKAVDRTVQQKPATSWVRIAVAMPMTGSIPEDDDLTPISGQVYDPQTALPTGPIVHALRGAYVAQKRANGSNAFSSNNGVLIKLALMNMGSQEKSWELLKPKINELAQDTAHPLVAVVGLGVSRTETDQFAHWLHEPAHVPAIGAVLSAVSDPPGLFNVSPSNESYITELYRYLPTLARPGHALRYVEAVDNNGISIGKNSDAKDLYVADLHNRFHKKFNARQVMFRGSTGKSAGQQAVFTQVTQDVCGPSSTARPVVLFGGRPRDLQPLLDELAGANCPNEPIVAAAATGIVVGNTMRESLERGRITLVFVSSKNTDAWLTQAGSQRPDGFDDFMEAYRSELDIPAAKVGPSLQDGYALSLHDTVGIAATALRRISWAAEDPLPNGEDVLSSLQNINTKEVAVLVSSGRLFFPNSDAASYACGRAIVISQTTGTGPLEQVVFTTNNLPACQP